MSQTSTWTWGDESDGGSSLSSLDSGGAMRPARPVDSTRQRVEGQGCRAYRASGRDKKKKGRQDPRPTKKTPRARPGRRGGWRIGDDGLLAVVCPSAFGAALEAYGAYWGPIGARWGTFGAVLQRAHSLPNALGRAGHAIDAARYSAGRPNGYLVRSRYMQLIG